MIIDSIQKVSLPNKVVWAIGLLQVETHADSSGPVISAWTRAPISSTIHTVMEVKSRFQNQTMTEPNHTTRNLSNAVRQNSTQTKLTGQPS
jgi:hypothetical protein